MDLKFRIRPYSSSNKMSFRKDQGKQGDRKIVKQGHLNKISHFKFNKNETNYLAKTLKIPSSLSNFKSKINTKTFINTKIKQNKDFNFLKTAKTSTKKRDITLPLGNIEMQNNEWKIGNYLSINSQQSVFRALRLDTGDFIIVKKILRTSNSRQIQILSKFQGYQGIVIFYGYQSDLTHNYLYFQHVSHRSLKEVIHEFGKLDSNIFWIYMRQVISILQHLHSQGYIHNDIKASNFLIDQFGKIKLSDLGNCKHISQRKSCLTSVLWSAPEILRGQIGTVNSDIWSVGCLAVELLTGKLPWAQLNFQSTVTAIFCIGKWQQNPSIVIKKDTLEWNMISRCLQICASNRPNCKELSNYLPK